MSSEITNLLESAVHAAIEAGKITLRYFQSEVSVEFKGDASPVTIADREAEEWVVNFVQREFPDHGILGEEFGEHPGTSPYRWIIDPIDGTKSFIRGVPMYGTMIAIEDRSRKDAVVGVVNFPPLGDIVWAGKGCGAYWNGRRTRVSATSSLRESTLLTTDLRNVNERTDHGKFHALIKKTKLFRMWGDCYGHMLVATGRAEIMADPKMSFWDIAALKPIVEEAGGHLINWSGQPGLYMNEAISCNDAVREELVGLLRSHS